MNRQAPALSESIRFTPVAHISGTYSRVVDFTARLPWLYAIMSAGSRVIYVGETYDQAGISSRLASHFGPYLSSSLRKNAEQVANVHTLRPPYLVVCARLPLGEDGDCINGVSKQVRLGCESVLHQLIAQSFVAPKGDWTIVSTPTPGKSPVTEVMELVAGSVYDCVDACFQFLETISISAPFQVVVLEQMGVESAPSEKEFGVLIEELEVLLYEWMIGWLEAKYQDRWWSSGVPENIRVECATRKERESDSDDLPPHAFLTLIDLRDIARRNWDIVGAAFEAIGAVQGRDKATQWIVDLNEARKLWAHPIKRTYRSIEPVQVSKFRSLHARVRPVLQSYSPSVSSTVTPKTDP